MQFFIGCGITKRKANHFEFDCKTTERPSKLSGGLADFYSFDKLSNLLQAREAQQAGAHPKLSRQIISATEQVLVKNFRRVWTHRYIYQIVQVTEDIYQQFFFQ